MVTRPNTPASKGREELVKQISSLPAMLLKGLKGGEKSGTDVLDLARNMRREGAHPTEIYDETKKFTDPTSETGVYQNPAGQFLFDIPDDQSKLTSMAENFMKGNFGPGGESPQVQLDRLLKHDLLYDYAPDMRKQPTVAGRQFPGDDPEKAGGMYSAPGHSYPEGAIEATGRADLDPNAADMWSTRNILTHEIQHGLQNRFQLPRGGNPDLKELTQFHTAELQPHAKQIRSDLRDEFENWFDTQGRQSGMNYTDAFQLWQRLYPDKFKLLDDAEKVAFATPQTRAADRHFLYEGMAGEQSANRASANLGKNIEQLRSEYPFETSTPNQMPWPLQSLRFGDTAQDWALPEEYFNRNMTVRGPK
jgi:hypothetical protein